MRREGCKSRVSGGVKFGKKKSIEDRADLTEERSKIVEKRAWGIGVLVYTDRLKRGKREKKTTKREI